MFLFNIHVLFVALRVAEGHQTDRLYKRLNINAIGQNEDSTVHLFVCFPGNSFFPFGYEHAVVSDSSFTSIEGTSSLFVTHISVCVCVTLSLEIAQHPRKEVIHQVVFFLKNAFCSWKIVIVTDFVEVCLHLFITLY